MGYEVKLDVFEGPLDLLLYLIKKNEIDIYDIPIALITGQYLAHIEMMKSLNLDIAGEYLVLASTLIHIKSRMLLPSEGGTEGDEDEPDPRSELVKQLLEYQMYKEAAVHLEGRPILDKDVFKRGYVAEENAQGDDDIYMELSVYDLVDAFFRIMTSIGSGNEVMEIDVEKMSLTDRMNDIMDMLAQRKKLTFVELLGDHPDRRMVLYTFLALLELMKSRMVKVYQASAFGVIRVSLSMVA
jgi:segregation and condensation protein A